MANAAKNDFNDGVYMVTFHTQIYRDICLIHPIVILKFRNIFFTTGILPIKKWVMMQ